MRIIYLVSNPTDGQRCGAASPAVVRFSHVAYSHSSGSSTDPLASCFITASAAPGHGINPGVVPAGDHTHLIDAPRDIPATFGLVGRVVALVGQVEPEPEPHPPSS